MSKHYLQQELLELLSTDSKVFEFLDSAAFDGLWFWDLDDPDHEWMSPRFWTTFGIDPETKEHRASEWQHLINPDDLALALKNFNAHLEDPSEPYDQIVRYKHSDDSTVWVRCRGTAIRDENGKPIRMLGAHTDITDLMRVQMELEGRAEKELGKQRKLADQARKSSEEKSKRLHELAAELGDLSDNQSKILEGMTSAIFVVNDDLTIMYANKAAEILFAYSPEEFRGLPINSLVPLADRSPHLDVMKKYISNPTFKRMGSGRDVQGIRKDGSKVPLEIALNPIVFKGHKSVLVNAIDITLRVEAQHALEITTEKLRARNQELDDFACIIAHDLRDPIGRIQTIVELIEHYEESGDAARKKDAIRSLKATSSHSIELIGDLYSYACIEADGLDQGKFESLSIGRLFDQALENISDKLVQASVIRDDGGQLINTIESLAVQVLQNILGNAVKYGPDDGLEINICVSLKQDYLAVTIEDNGPGIPVEAQEAVFEPFRQLNKGRSNTGIGLGLATARRLMKVLGGSIRCETANSGGARFCLEFPRAGGESARTSA